MPWKISEQRKIACHTGRYANPFGAKFAGALASRQELVLAGTSHNKGSADERRERYDGRVRPGTLGGRRPFPTAMHDALVEVADTLSFSVRIAKTRLGENGLG